MIHPTISAPVDGASRAYDANGNTTLAPAFTYVYNENNRLSQVDYSNISLEQFYNGRGERTSVRCIGNDFQTIMIYDRGGQVLSETDAIDSFSCELCELNSSKRSVGDSRPPAPRGAKTGTDVAQFTREYIYLDGQPIAFVYGSTVAYIEADHLGTPRKAFQSNSLVFNWPLLGNPCGAQSATTSLPISLRFPGQQVSRWGGLYYNYFRDYEPGAGRYVQSDPIGLRGGTETYGYVEQAPLHAVDPKGLLSTVQWCLEHPEAAAQCKEALPPPLPKPLRVVPPYSGGAETGAPNKRCPDNCKSEYFNTFQACSDLGPWYQFASKEDAAKSQGGKPVNRRDLNYDQGDCVQPGGHWRIEREGAYVGYSIIECRCCEDNGGTMPPKIKPLYAVPGASY